jgi:hypothetical protein
MHNGPNDDKREARRFGQPNALTQRANNGADAAIAQFRKSEREQFWHALAVQHQQRVRVIELLTEISAKLSVLINTTLRNDANVHERYGRQSQ